MFDFVRNIKRRMANKKTIKVWKWLRENLGKRKDEYPEFKNKPSWLIPDNHCYLCEVNNNQCIDCPLCINNQIKCGDANHPYRKWINNRWDGLTANACAIDEIILLCEQHYT